MGSMSIGEVARWAGVRPSALRYYEGVGLLPSPERTNGRRRYDGKVLREVLDRLAAVGSPSKPGSRSPRSVRSWMDSPRIPPLGALARPRPREADGGRCAHRARPRHEEPPGEGAALRVLAPGGVLPCQRRNPKPREPTRNHSGTVPNCGGPNFLVFRFYELRRITRMAPVFKGNNPPEWLGMYFEDSFSAWYAATRATSGFTDNPE